MNSSTANKRIKKRVSAQTKTIAIVTSCFLAIILGLSIMLAVFINRKPLKYFSPPAINLPNEESYALKKYDYNDLHQTIITVRSDIMNVTKRGVKRSKTTLLDDVYEIANNQNITSPSVDAKIDFKGIYPSAHNPGYSVNANTIASKFATEAQKMFPADSEANLKYLYYYKYMLLSQGYNLAFEAQKLSAETVNGDAEKEAFKKWLKKHPAADAQYGACEGTDNAVVKEITIDPLYRSQHATGLYLPAGEVVSVKVEGLKEGELLGITVGLQNSLAWAGNAPNNYGYQNTVGKNNFFFNADIGILKGDFKNLYTRNDENVLIGHNYIQSQWGRQNSRLPWLTADFTFSKNGTYYIGTPFGGIMHINPRNCNSNAKTTISGAVEMPHYILGVTSPEYFDQYLRNAPGPGAVLDTENGQLVCAYGNAMRNVKTEEINKLAMLWHSFFSVNESFTGGTYNRANLVMFDIHVPAGAAVALGNYTYACPTGWFSNAMNYRGLLAGGQWGILHEIGHNHGNAYGVPWGFAGGQEGEVRNNALTVLAYIMFCDTGTSVANNIGVEHGFVCHPYNSLTGSPLNNPNKTDFAEMDYFQTLSMYTNIMHSFGAEKFYELLYSYKDTSSFVDNDTYNKLINDIGGNDQDKISKIQTIAKRSEFAYRCSVIYGMNFINYFNSYKANITREYFSNQQWEAMHNLPNYEPVACKYAGGIDGVKTGGDYIVSFGEDVEFDLIENTFSSLDSADKKGFEIVNIIQPAFGTLTHKEDGKFTYSFNADYNGQFDQFSFKVKMADGVIHQLDITLRIKYNGVGVKSYKSQTAIQGTDNAQKWAFVEEEIKNSTPINSSVSSTVVTDNVGSDKWHANEIEFYWIAPKDGKVKFCFKYDDWLKFYFGSDFENLEEQGYYTSHSNGKWITLDKEYEVKQGKKYAIKLLNVNIGGGGSATIGYNYLEEEAKQMPVKEVFHPNYKANYAPEEYVFEPNFIVSKKDGIKVANNATNKSEWKILKAVTDGKSAEEDNKYIQGGRTDKVSRTEIVKKDGLPSDFLSNLEPGTKVVDNGDSYTLTSIVEFDKWDYLLDGDVGTVFHTSYGRNDIDYCNTKPYEFVIDTNSEQQFNYFNVITRNGAIGVSKVTKYELQISNDNFDKDIRTIAQGDVLEYKNNVATLNFDNVTGRYFKFIAKDSTGNNGKFVVIAEFDAGLTSHVQRLVPATSGYLYHSKGWQNTANISSEQSGYLLANGKKQKLVFRFEGSQLSIYAAKGKGFGKADLYIDGQKMQTLDFANSEYESRKLMAYYSDLENKQHTVELITKNDGRVMINMFGISYASSILNAPNIYLEKALTISLVVFILLFLLVFSLLMCLLFIPKFRKFMGNNKLIAKLDVLMEKQKEKRKQKRAEKRQQKQQEKTQSQAKLHNKEGSKVNEVKKDQQSNSNKSLQKTTTNKNVANVSTKQTKTASEKLSKQIAKEKKVTTKKIEEKNKKSSKK